MTPEELNKIRNIVGALTVYNNSAKALQAVIQALDAQTRDTGGPDINSSFISVLILYAFNCEVGLKALCKETGVRYHREHNLKNLYNLLPGDVQNQIKEGFKSQDFKDNFDTYLNDNKSVFEKWRYFFDENPGHGNLSFLHELSDSITNIARDKFNNLENS